MAPNENMPQTGKKPWTKPEIVELDVEYDTKSGFGSQPDLFNTNPS